MKAVGLKAVVAAAALLVTTSCDSVIYDYEEDCSGLLLLKFRYDLNLKWANAFPAEVKSVHLYVFDQSKTLCREYVLNANNSNLADEEYALELNDYAAGKYHLLAWCGLNNEGVTEQSFTVPQATLGVTRVEDLTCWMERKSDSRDAAYRDTNLNFLFHGELDIDVPAAVAKGEKRIYTMYLTKDTNHFRIVLQHLSAEDLDPEDFDFEIVDHNGYMASDNSLLEDDRIHYRTWNKMSGVAGVIRGNEVVDVNIVIADITVPRTMATHCKNSDPEKNMTLTITNKKNGEVIAKIPVLDYALLENDLYYGPVYGRYMDAQEFLDRQDEYMLTFFIDEDYHWWDAEILIHSWRVVLNDIDL